MDSSSVVQPVVELSPDQYQRLLRQPQEGCRIIAQACFNHYQILSDDRDEASSEAAITLYRHYMYQQHGFVSSTIAAELGDVYMERFLRQGQKKDADGAESCLRSILAEDPGDFVSIAKLGAVLILKYEMASSSPVIEEAVELLENALVRISEDDGRLPLLIDLCGVSLLHKSEAQNSSQDLEISIELFRAGLLLPCLKPKEFWLLSQHLGEALRLRFEVTETRSDIAEARKLLERIPVLEGLLPREALNCGYIYAKILYTQYLYDRDPDSQGKLRIWYALVMSLWRMNHKSPLGAELLQASGKAQNERFFSSSGRHGIAHANIRGGLDWAVRTLASWPEEDQKRGLAKYLYEYGIAEELHYRWYMTSKTIELAGQALLECIQSSNPRSANFVLRSCAASRVLRRYDSSRISHSAQSLELAELVLRKALLIPLPISARARATLAVELARQRLRVYEDSKSLVDLEQAIRHFRKAVVLSRVDFVSHLEYLEGLASALKRRGDALKERGDVAGSMDDFEMAASAMKRLLKITENRGVTFHDSKATLGEIRSAQYELSQEEKYAVGAIKSFQELLNHPDGSPPTKLKAALNAIGLQKKLKRDSPAVARAMLDALKAISQVISEGDSRNEQLFKIRMFSPMVMAAASAVLKANLQVEEAVQVLESQRSLLWNRLLNRKADLTELRETYHKIAERYSTLSTQLSQKEPNFAAWSEMRYAERLSSDRFHLTDEYDRLVAEIRSKPGFEDFLVPSSSVDTFREYASEGPIVSFIHAGGDAQLCRAVIIAPDGVSALELHDFGDAMCEKMFNELKEALALQQRLPDQASNRIDAVLKWMWEAAAEPILKHLGLLAPATPNSTDLPRIWWMSSGWINSLPIHAAGDHQRALDTGEKCTVLDNVVSSYTPTLGVLGHNRRTMSRMVSTATATNSTPTALLASMETTPDMRPNLPHAPDEVTTVQSILEPSFTVTALNRPRPRRSDIIPHLRTCTLALFACHGVADEKDPLKSRICLQDWKSRPLNVRFLMRMSIENCQLAYLSACEMAISKDALLREEGLHMSGAFQMAGVPNTVATWWQILDLISVRVSREFFEGLRDQNGDVDMAKSALALHKVMRRMRDERASAYIWGAYVHFGV